MSLKWLEAVSDRQHGLDRGTSRTGNTRLWPAQRAIPYSSADAINTDRFSTLPMRVG